MTIAVRVNGTEAMVGTLAATLVGSAIATDVVRVARANPDLAAWRAAAADVRATHAGDLSRRAHRSVIDEASVYATHPPTGYRLWVVSTWPARPPGDLAHDVTLVDAGLARAASWCARQYDLA